MINPAGEDTICLPQSPLCCLSIGLISGWDDGLLVSRKGFESVTPGNPSGNVKNSVAKSQSRSEWCQPNTSAQFVARVNNIMLKRMECECYWTRSQAISTWTTTFCCREIWPNYCTSEIPYCMSQWVRNNTMSQAGTCFSQNLHNFPLFENLGIPTFYLSCPRKTKIFVTIGLFGRTAYSKINILFQYTRT